MIGDHFLATHFLYPVHASIVEACVLWFVSESINHHTSHHHAVLSQYLGQPSRIDACDGRNLLAFQPIGERLLCIPMGIPLAIISHNQCLGMNALALHKQWQAIVAHTRIWHTVVAYQRKGRHEYLSRITGVGQTLGVARHGRVEHHLASGIALIAERVANKLAPIVENQFRFSHIL